MQVTENIHTLRIPFSIPLSPEKSIARHVFITMVLGETILLIDSGVKGTDLMIFDYLEKQGRKPENITQLLLSHSHPDHIGGASSIRKKTGCMVLAHALEQNWIEDTEKQKKERPVPGFDMLVEGPVPVDILLEHKQTLELGTHTGCLVIHTPGHSKGSLSLLFPDEAVLFTGDALPIPGDLPIYDDIATSLNSIKQLRDLSEQADILLSSWEEPVMGREHIQQRISDAVAYLKRIHLAVVDAHQKHEEIDMPLCMRVAEELGLPLFAANPIVATAFMSSLKVAGQKDLFDF